MVDTPTVFISYSHANAVHKEWVEKLATDLRNNGIDATLDQWEIGPGDDLAAFMERGVTTADRVLAICTPNYVQKANAGEGGVGYEKMIVTAELVKNLGTKKFIPIVRDSDGEKQVPVFLGSRLYVDFDNNSMYDEKLMELLHELHGQKISSKPPIGSNPFIHHDEAEEETAPEQKHTNIVTIDEEWLQQERSFASAEFNKVNLKGSLEIWFGLENKLNANQEQLLQAARGAEIKTFGWPIAVLLENQEEYKPRSRQNGIYANIPIGDRASYDYWSINNNGDFYLLKSLFEDNREPEKLFFDTRIVRTTEALLYCRRLYSSLGANDEDIAHFYTKYSGISGRELSAASSRRMLHERATNEDEVSANTSFKLIDIDENPVEIVKTLLDPVFMLFDFFKLSDQVYTDIVNKFINGEVT